MTTPEPSHPPLVLTDEFRKRFKRQRLAADPLPATVIDWNATAARTGVPADVLLALESMRLLADQGNVVAASVFESECKRLGLWYQKGFFHMGGAGR